MVAVTGQVGLWLKNYRVCDATLRGPGETEMKLASAIIAACLSITFRAAYAQTSRAVLCLDKEFKLGSVRELTIPNKAVFRNHGPITGDLTGSWRVTDPEKSRNAAIITTEAVTLTTAKRCAEVRVRMFVDGILNEQTSAKASDHDYWSIDDVLDYTPGHKPVIEFGKLVDDMAVLAQLRTDVDDALAVPEPKHDDDVNAAQCLASAKSLAAQVEGALSRQTSAAVFIGHPAAGEMSISCDVFKPYIFLSWDRRAKPASATMQLIARSGSLLTGATQDQIRSLVDACITQALKPESSELANIEYDGTRAECQAFTRDGGAGSVTIFRRFGPYPPLAAPSAAALRDLDRAAEKLRAAERKQSKESEAFAKWWLDRSVPSNVKSTLMLITRMQALGERCPSWSPPWNKVVEMSATAGIEPSDIQPGGRYWETYTLLAAAMRQGTQDESAQDACETALKYGR